MAITVRRHPRRAWRPTAPVPNGPATLRDRNPGHPADDPSASLQDLPELQIRSLLDDAQLRRAMGLDVAASPRPQPRFDRRRLLEQAAA